MVNHFSSDTSVHPLYGARVHLVYDAFGRVTSETNPAVDSLFLFTARPFDQDTQLQNNLNRWYDASVGRWLSEDPIGFAGGDGNLYRYVGNKPATHPDPKGLQVTPSSLAIVFPGPITIGTGSFLLELAVLGVPPQNLAHVALGEHRIGYRVRYNRPTGVCEATSNNAGPRICSTSVVLTQAVRTRGAFGITLLFGTPAHFDSARDPTNQVYSFPEYTGQRPFGPGSLADAPHSSGILTPQIHDVSICAVCRAELCDKRSGVRMQLEYVLGCVNFEFHESPAKLIVDGREILEPGKVAEVPGAPPGWVFEGADRRHRKHVRAYGRR